MRAKKVLMLSLAICFAQVANAAECDNSHGTGSGVLMVFGGGGTNPANCTVEVNAAAGVVGSYYTQHNGVFGPYYSDKFRVQNPAASVQLNGSHSINLRRYLFQATGASGLKSRTSLDIFLVGTGTSWYVHAYADGFNGGTQLVSSHPGPTTVDIWLEPNNAGGSNLVIKMWPADQPQQTFVLTTSQTIQVQKFEQGNLGSNFPAGTSVTTANW